MKQNKGKEVKCPQCGNITSKLGIETFRFSYNSKTGKNIYQSERELAEKEDRDIQCLKCRFRAKEKIWIKENENA